MPGFQDLNKKLPDGRHPLREVTKMVLRQQCAQYSPHLLAYEEAEMATAPFPVRKRKGQLPRGQEWQVETYRHEVGTTVFKFRFYVAVTENWTIALLKDGWDAIFIPSPLPIYRLLEEMGFTLS